MLRTFLLGCAIIWCQVANAQTAERIAALNFVRANGFVIPERVMVLRETTSDSTRPGKTPVGLRAQAATEIAQTIGRGAETNSIEDLLECRKMICVSRTDFPTLMVGDPAMSGNQKVVRVELYSSGLSRGATIRTLTSALVVVERRDTEWVGVRYSTRPVRTEPRLPPPLNGHENSFRTAPDELRLGNDTGRNSPGELRGSPTYR